MKKVACFLLVLTLGVFAMGCGEKKETKKTTDTGTTPSTAPEKTGEAAK